MGKFLNGLFIGFGIGLFIAPQTGEETRRLIMERVVALRKSILPEDEQPISIDTHPPQIQPLPAEPAQPATEFFSEPEQQGTPNVSLAPPIPIVTFASEPEEQGNISVPPADALSTPSNQSTSVTGSDSAITDTEQASGSTTNPVFVPDAEPDQRTPTEVPRNDTAITEKLPPLSGSSNVSGRTAKRKASTRTPNTSKSRGHSRS